MPRTRARSRAGRVPRRALAPPSQSPTSRRMEVRASSKRPSNRSWAAMATGSRPEHLDQDPVHRPVSRTMMRSPRTNRTSHLRAAASRWPAAPWTSEMAITRIGSKGSIRARGDGPGGPVRLRPHAGRLPPDRGGAAGGVRADPRPDRGGRVHGGPRAARPGGTRGGRPSTAWSRSRTRRGRHGGAGQAVPSSANRSPGSASTSPTTSVAHVVALDHSAYSNSITVEAPTRRRSRSLKASGLPHGPGVERDLRPYLMREDLERLGLDAYLDASVFSSEVGVRKPDPRIFREALERLGVEPTETVFVGERRIDDVSGPQAVGMRAVQTREFRQEADPARRAGRGRRAHPGAAAICSTRRAQPAIVRPPDTKSTWPVTNGAAGEAKNATATATSSGVARRRRGVAFTMASMIVRRASVERSSPHQGGVGGPGQTQFAVMPCRAISLREGLRQRDHSALARRVDGLAGGPDAAGIGGDVHHRAPRLGSIMSGRRHGRG